MNDPGAALADAALAQIGCVFRLYGRDPATGLDCVGLVTNALAKVGGHPVAPIGYGLRNIGVDQWLPLAQRSGLVLASGAIRTGDVLLIALAYGQHHLAIAADAVNAVHAHAGLRRVGLQPRDPDWHVHAKWRLAPPTES